MKENHIDRGICGGRLYNKSLTSVTQGNRITDEFFFSGPKIFRQTGRKEIYNV